jgi:hypothetical protein
MLNSDSVTATLEPDTVAVLGAELVDPPPQPAIATRAATATSPRASLVPISFRDRKIF